MHLNVIKNNDGDRKSFDIGHEADRELWVKCWQAAAAGAAAPQAGAHVSLLKCYKNTANLAKAHPNANNVIKVLQIVVAPLATSTGGSGGRSVDNSVNTLLCVVDVIRDRLMTPESLATLHNLEEAVEGVKDLLKRFPSAISAAAGDDNRSFDLYGRLSNFPDYIRAAQQWIAAHPAHHTEEQNEDLNEGEDNMSVEPWLGWRDRPTVGWLMSEGRTTWHHVPNMRNTYASEDEYAETLLRVWTLLTFYWGSGAVWPRCTCKLSGGGGGKDDGAKMCAEPLLAHCTNNNVRCCSVVSRAGERGACSNPATWRCHRMGPGHIALCSGCVRKQQDKLCGAGGPDSFTTSTDIYDAVVDREASRREGVVFYLSALKSRKPPKVEPNWKTTYRLTSSSMVAVVRLSASNEPLTRAHAIQWAEIANYSAFTGKGTADTPEYMQRSQGKIAVRLLSRGDCSSLRADADAPLEAGTRVALIDLRVFVPEVISVLATFANPRFAEQLRQIPFMGRLIGIEKSLPPLPATSSIMQCVANAILKSEIECIRMLPQEDKIAVVHSILGLAPIQSLYGTQLEAFANALYSSIHCTQGPPGTGKVFYFVEFVEYIIFLIFNNFFCFA